MTQTQVETETSDIQEFDQKFKAVFLIGLGGTGSHLAEPLVRLLHYHPNGTKKIVFVDGDSFEEKNRIRQLFDHELEGANKAEAVAKRIGIKGVKVVKQFIDKNKCQKLIKKFCRNDERFLIISAVDNHPSRRAIINALDEGNYENFVFISPGNSYDSGQVIIYAKENGESLTAHPFIKYPDIENHEGSVPGSGDGCLELAPSTPQLITANASAALGALMTVSAILDEDGWYEELHFSCRKMKIKAQGKPKEIFVD